MNINWLNEVLPIHGIKLTDDMLLALEKYESIVLSWNEKMNLTAITKEDEFLEKHFFDSIMAANSQYFKGKNLLDIGSGAGFPGIPLAILNPSMHVYLLEATAKKCGFLQEVVKELNLTNVTILNQRAEDIKSEQRNHFNIVISRAVSQMNIMLELGIPYLSLNGTLISMKGSRGEEEYSSCKRALIKLDAILLEKNIFKLPLSLETRSNYYFTKDELTTNKYPRDFAKIMANPL